MDNRCSRRTAGGLGDRLLQPALTNPTGTSVADKRLAIDLCSLRQELWRAEGEEVGDPLCTDRLPEQPSTRLVWTTTDRMVADSLTKKIVGHEPIYRLMRGETILLLPNPHQKNTTGVKSSSVDAEG